MPTKNTGLEHVLASLQVQLEALRDHEAGARGGRDPEDLRKMRVAVRRLRAILRASRPLFEAKWVKGLRSELDWLGTVLGEARDLDVLRGGPWVPRSLPWGAPSGRPASACSAGSRPTAPGHEAPCAECSIARAIPDSWRV